MYNYCVVYITAMLVLDYGGGASNGPSSVVITTLEVLQCCRRPVWGRRQAGGWAAAKNDETKTDVR